MLIDPMSPHASDFGGDASSPMISPPATPLQVQDMDYQNQAPGLESHRSSSLNIFRRRTYSAARTGKEETGICVNEEEHEVISQGATNSCVVGTY